MTISDFFLSRIQPLWLPPITTRGNPHLSINSHSDSISHIPHTWDWLRAQVFLIDSGLFKLLSLIPHCEVLFLPCRHFWAFFPCLISCCRPGLFTRLWKNSACLIWPCLPCWSVLLSACRLPWSLAWTLFMILSCLRGIWRLGLTYACMTCLVK